MSTHNITYKNSNGARVAVAQPVLDHERRYYNSSGSRYPSPAVDDDIFSLSQAFQDEIDASPQMLKDLVAASEAVSHIGTRKDDKSDELRRRVARVEEEHLHVSPEPVFQVFRDVAAVTGIHFIRHDRHDSCNFFDFHPGEVSHVGLAAEPEALGDQGRVILKSRQEALVFGLGLDPLVRRRAGAEVRRLYSRRHLAFGGALLWEAARRRAALATGARASCSIWRAFELAAPVREAAAGV